jgi:hypothetical protein
MKLEPALIVCLLLLSGCSPQAANKGSSNPSKLADEFNRESSDQTGGTLTQQQRDDLKNGTASDAPPMDISGIAFAPGALPASIEGKAFYSTESFGGSVQIKGASEAVFKPYRQPDVKCTYSNKTEGDAPRLVLTFKQDGAEQTMTYNVTRGEQYAMLHAADVRDGWPIVLKGIVE